MTTVFFAPPVAFQRGRVTLPEDEARHAVKVLRHQTGDEILVVDGAGSRHTVRLVEVSREEVVGEVVATEREVGEPGYRLTIGLGVLKNPSRFETFAEKAVELGISEIVPLTTERTERPRIKTERLRNILIAAMKQSGRSRLPVLRDPVGLDELIGEGIAGLRLICHEAASNAPPLGEALASGGRPAHITILVGPEGGFTESEVEHARAAGYSVVSLGARRLRAETAGIVAAALTMAALT